MRDSELVRLPREAMLQVGLLLASAFLLSRFPSVLTSGQPCSCSYIARGRPTSS